MKSKGFTLIELLIVVAIIAILAAIAVPNFLEAQTRAKVGRVKSDMRTISIALESYALDNNNTYPYLQGYVVLNIGQWDRGGFGAATPLTTPIAYLSTVLMLDPFCKEKDYKAYGEVSKQGSSNIHATYQYVNVKLNRKNKVDAGRPMWFLLSLGPDYKIEKDIITGSNIGIGGYSSLNVPQQYRTFDYMNYDPSNGTISGGDILRHQ